MDMTGTKLSGPALMLRISLRPARRKIIAACARRKEPGARFLRSVHCAR